MSNLDALKENIPDDLDGVIIIDSVNRYYFTEFYSTQGLLFVTKKEAFLLLDFRYIEMAKVISKKIKLCCYLDLKKTLGEIFKKNNIKTVALQAEYFCLKSFNEYKNYFAELNFVTDGFLDELISNFRSVKSQQEIEKIKKSQEVTDSAFSHI